MIIFDLFVNDVYIKIMYVYVRKGYALISVSSVFKGLREIN